MPDDAKLTELDAITVLSGDEVIYVVDDVATTPTEKKMLATDFLAAAPPTPTSPGAKLYLYTNYT